MKKTCTLKNLLFKAVFAYLLLAVTSVYGQREYTFEVNTPSGISGSYDVIHATFGPICGLDAVTGDFTIADDGSANPTQACVAIQNDLTGQIALIDRGSCNFSIKCYNAQLAGAIGVVVCNNNTDPIFGMGAGTNSDLVTIPSVMMSMADCATIRAEIPTVNVTIAPVVGVAPPDTDVIYYEEDFDSGPNGWTSTSLNEPDEVFFWEETGIFPTFGGGNVGIPLPGTSCTGAMGFPSGWYQTGMTGNTDSIPATYIDFDAELISPVLDLSGINNAISLKFNQRVQRLNPNAGTTFNFVAYSLDGGDTWSDPIDINVDVPINSADTPNPATVNTVTVGIPEIQGQPNVRVKFIWRLDFYHWIIDDIKLVKRASHDLSLPEDFFAAAPNAMTPITQAEEWGFVTDVKNDGSEDQTNVNLNVTITDDNSGAIAYFEDLSYGTVMSDSNIMNVPFPGCYIHDGTTVSTYTGVYSVSADSADFDPSNNQLTFQFMTTDSTFAKEFEPAFGVRPADANWADDEPHSWSYGNYYHIVNGDYDASSATFGLETTADQAGQLVTLNLYEWLDSDGDDVIDSDERGVPKATALYEVQGTEVGEELITVQLAPLNPNDGTPGSINLSDNTGYVLMVEFSTQALGEDMQFSAGTGWDYGPTEFRTDQTAFGDKPRRLADFIGIGDPLSAEYTTNGFANTVPVARLNLSGGPIAVEELDAANILNISPNPADKFINLNVELVNAQAAQVRILDVSGRVIYFTAYDNVSNESFNYDISQFPAGTYFLNFTTEEGVRTERFVVQR